MRLTATAVLPIVLIGVMTSSSSWAQPAGAGSRTWIRIQSNVTPQGSAASVVRHGVSLNTFRQFSEQDFVQRAVPVRSMTTSAAVADRKEGCRLVGADDSLGELPIPSLQQGRLITARDQLTRASVCVISDTLALRLFPNANPVGKLVRVEQDYFRIVGVLNAPEKSSVIRELDLVIPLTTMLARRGTTVIKTQSGQFMVEDYALNELWLETIDNRQVRPMVERILKQAEPDSTFRITEIPPLQPGRN